MKKELPSGWQEFQIKDICSINYGKGLGKNNIVEGNIPVYSSGGIIGYHNESLINSKGVIIGRKGNAGSVFYSNSPFFCIDTAFYVEPNDNIDLKFLYYKLISIKLERHKIDSAVPGINRDTIYSISITVPPIDEQKRIADILSAFDDLIENLNKLIAKKEIYKKGVMQRVLSGKVRFEGFTDEWETVKLKDILIAGSKDRVPDTSKYKKITIKLHNKGIEFSNIERKMADKRPFYIRKKDEIIIGKQNYFNGSIAIVDEEFDNTICSNAIMSFTVNEDCNNKFIYFLLSRKSYMQKYYHLANGTGQKELSESDFLNFNLLIPSLEEQNKIAELLTLIDRDIEILKRLLYLRKLQKKGVMQKLLTGEVRV